MNNEMQSWLHVESMIILKRLIEQAEKQMAGH